MHADPDDEVLITIGAQQVIDSTFRILVGAGDEVLLFDPEYASTEPAIRMAGGHVVPVPLALEKGEWRFDFDALARRASRKTKLLVMSNGGNPSGIVYTPRGARADRRPGPPARLLGLLRRGVREDAAGRDDALQHRVLARDEGADGDGLLLLQGVRDDRVPDRLRGRPRPRSSTTCTASSASRSRRARRSGSARRTPCSPATWSPGCATTSPTCERKRDYLVDRLNRIPGIRCNTPKGCYFTFPDVRGLGMPTFQLAEHLLRAAAACPWRRASSSARRARATCA